jgi:hypothetical protein
MDNLKERFSVIPEIVAQSTRETNFTGSGTTAYVTDGTVNVPAKPPRGLAYRVTCWGTKTGTNAIHAMNLVLAGTELISVEADDTTAKDWIAHFLVIFHNPKVQRAAAHIASETLDCGADVADGSIDCSAGGALRLQIEKHTSDDVTVDGLVIERWVMPGSEGLAVTE